LKDGRQSHSSARSIEKKGDMKEKKTCHSKGGCQGGGEKERRLAEKG